MARPLIRRRITVTGRQRTDIDADLLIQALIQIAEDETNHTRPGTDPAVPTRTGTPPNHHTPASRTRRPMSSTAPSPHRPASRTRARRTARDAADRSGNHEHRPT